jgi:hypothetical protein
MREYARAAVIHHGEFPQSKKAREVVATDYDTPRKTDEELHEAAETLELPGADLSGEELSVRVVPRQVDEFACSRCFLVHHITQMAKGEGQTAVCRECA